MIIVVEGDSLSYVQTQSELLAKRLDAFYLDTTLTYQYLANQILEKSINPHDKEEVVLFVDSLPFEILENLHSSKESVNFQIEESKFKEVMLLLTEYRGVGKKINSVHKNLVGSLNAVVSGDFVQPFYSSLTSCIYLFSKKKAFDKTEKKKFVCVDGKTENEIHLHILNEIHQKPRSWKFMYWFLYQFGIRVIDPIMFNLRSSGQENLPKDRGYILASNHRSHLDPVILGFGAKQMLSFLARDTLFEKPMFKWFIESLNAFAIKRGKGDITSIIRLAVRLIISGHALCVFPEGTRSKDLELGSIKPGAALMALRTGAPIIPAWMEGTEKALSRGGSKVNKTPVSLVFGPPVFLDDLMSLPVSKDKVHIVQGRIREALLKLRDENKALDESRVNL